VDLQRADDARGGTPVVRPRIRIFTCLQAGRPCSDERGSGFIARHLHKLVCEQKRRPRGRRDASSKSLEFPGPTAQAVRPAREMAC